MIDHNTATPSRRPISEGEAMSHLEDTVWQARRIAAAEAMHLVTAAQCRLNEAREDATSDAEREALREAEVALEAAFDKIIDSIGAWMDNGGREDVKASLATFVKVAAQSWGAE